MLDATELVYKFGEWIVYRFLHLLSLSCVGILPLPVLIESVYHAYVNNPHNPPILPSCHPVATFIIKQIGRRIISTYCILLAKAKLGSN